jgi:hypothetical protein
VLTGADSAGATRAATAPCTGPPAASCKQHTHTQPASQRSLDDVRLADDVADAELRVVERHAVHCARDGVLAGVDAPACACVDSRVW